MPLHTSHDPLFPGMELRDYRNSVLFCRSCGFAFTDGDYAIGHRQSRQNGPYPTIFFHTNHECQTLHYRLRGLGSGTLPSHHSRECRWEPQRDKALIFKIEAEEVEYEPETYEWQIIRLTSAPFALEVHDRFERGCAPNGYTEEAAQAARSEYAFAPEEDFEE